MNDDINYKKCPKCGLPISSESPSCEFCNEPILNKYEEQFVKEKQEEQHVEGLYNDGTPIKNETVSFSLLPSRKTLNIIRNFFLIILMPFIIYNLLIFVRIFNETKNKPFAPARAYMLSAEKINELYIFPLSHMTKWEHPVTKPFYFIRDKLYNTGLSKFPKNEGEREIWWYKIRYVEFRELVEDNLVAYCLKKKDYIPTYLYSKVNRFIDWDNELYSHIKPIANAKITDKEYSNFKLDMFVQLARLYVSMNHLLVIEPAAISYDKTGSFRPKIFWISDKEVKQYDEIYQTYLNLLEDSKRHDKESYKYFFNDENRKIWSWALIFEVSNNILVSKFYNKELNCNDKYLRIHSDIHKIIRDFYLKNEKSLSFGKRARFSLYASTFEPFIAYKFRDCNNLKDYSNAFINYARNLSPNYANYSWEDIKNLEYRVLKQDKRQDELILVKNVLGDDK